MAKKNTIPEATTDEALTVVTDTPVSETAVEETTAPAKKTKRRKSRTAEELNELPYSKGWTDAETRAYINYLREEIALKNNMLQEFKLSCKRFKEMYQNCDTAYQRLKAAIENREGFIKQVVSTAYASIMNMKEIQV